jgi:hypothetical protein
MKISFIKEYADCYENKTVMSKKTFWKSMIWLWGMLLISMILVRSLWITFFLFIVGFSVTYHISWIAKGRRGGHGE